MVLLDIGLPGLASQGRRGLVITLMSCFAGREGVAGALPILPSDLAAEVCMASRPDADAPDPPDPPDPSARPVRTYLVAVYHVVLRSSRRTREGHSGRVLGQDAASFSGRSSHFSVTTSFSSKRCWTEST